MQQVQTMYQTQVQTMYRCKKMGIYNNALKLARFIHIVKEKCIKFSALPGIFWNFWRQPEVTAHYKKIPPLYISQEKFTGYCREFKGK